jgi:hypothetical protein
MTKTGRIVALAHQPAAEQQIRDPAKKRHDRRDHDSRDPKRDHGDPCLDFVTAGAR